MKRMLNLTYNEIIKEYKKTSNKALIAFILLTSIILPIGAKSFINKEPFESVTISSYAIGGIEEEEEYIGGIKNPKYILHEILQELGNEKDSLIEENNIQKQWKIDELNKVYHNKLEVAIIDEIKKGIDKEVILKELPQIDSERVEEYYTLSKEELDKKVDVLNKEIEKIRKDVLEDNNAMPYLQDKIVELNKSLEASIEVKKEIEKEIKENPNNAELKTELEYRTKDLQSTEAMISILKYRLEYEVQFDNNNWKSRTLSDIEKKLELLKEPLRSEEEFISYYQENVGNGLTYDEYKRNYEKARKDLVEDIELSWYSLEDDIPRIEFARDARTVIDLTYSIIVALVIFLAIILGGGIVSTEYTSETIRLLMIRPVSRIKILLSKLLAVTTISYGVLMISMILLSIVSGVFWGVSSLGIDVLLLSGEAVAAKNFVLYFVSNVLFSSISIIFITAIAFMLSTVSKNTALSVSVGMLVFLGSGTIAQGLALIKLEKIATVVLPYVNLPMLKLNPGYTEMFTNHYGVQLQPAFGAIQLLILSVIFIGIAFITFSKKDVRN